MSEEKQDGFKDPTGLTQWTMEVVELAPGVGGGHSSFFVDRDQAAHPGVDHQGVLGGAEGNEGVAAAGDTKCLAAGSRSTNDVGNLLGARRALHVRRCAANAARPVLPLVLDSRLAGAARRRPAATGEGGGEGGGGLEQLPSGQARFSHGESPWSGENRRSL